MQSGDNRSAIILCHGWGGVRTHFNQAYAPEFARAGYVVLTFDYRGWGEIDPVPQGVNKIGRLKGTQVTSADILQRKLKLRLLAFTVVAVISIGPNGQIIASQSLTVIVADSAPKGWQIFDGVKQFTPEYLYEQINGRASFFLAYDMIRVTYVSFVDQDGVEKFINLKKTRCCDLGTRYLTKIKAQKSV